MNSSADVPRQARTASSSPARSWAGWLLFSAPVFLYFAAFAWLGQNLPRNDDPPATLPFLLAVHRGEAWVRVLFDQYAEHRITYLRLVTLLVQRLTGAVDYRVLGLLGNLSLVGVLAVFGAWFRRWNLMAYVLPVPFLLFHWGFHHNTFVAMMALQNLTIVFWGVLSAWWLADGRTWRPYAALLVAVVATYTSGSGMLTLAIGSGYLLLTRRWQALVSWLLVSGLAVGLYFWQLQPINHPEVLSNALPISGFAVLMSGSYLDLLPNLLKSSVEAGAPSWVRYLLYLRIGLCFALGLAALGFAGYVLVRRGRQLVRAPGETRPTTHDDPALTFPFLALLFVLGTVLVVARGRYDGGLSQSFAVRYKIYSPVLMTILYGAGIYLLNPARRRAGSGAALVLATTLCVWSYVQNLNQVLQQNKVARAGLFNLRHNGVWLVSGRYYGDIDPLLNGALAEGLYRPSARLLAAFDGLPNRADAPLLRWPVQVPRIDAFWTVVSDSGGPESLLDDPAAGAYFVLLGRAHRYVISAEQNRTVWGTYRPGFQAYVPIRGEDLAPGRYRLCVYVVKRGTKQLYDTGRTIDVPARN
jgi:hypothetical protein